MRLSSLSTLATLVAFAAPVAALGAQAERAERAMYDSLSTGVNQDIRALVAQLDLEKYKATIKGLTKFGDRRQGTDRNRAATDWIEAQLKSYGCTNTERIKYQYPAARGGGGGGGGGGRGADSVAVARGSAVGGGGGRGAAAAGGGRGGAAADTGGRGGARGTGGGGRGAAAAADTAGRGARGNASAAGAAAGGGTRGGGRGGGQPQKGFRAPTGVNTDPLKQPDEALRELNRQPTSPGDREQVYCTKIGTTRPNEMFIIGAHMDGHGWGSAANDDGSGTALVMELARILHGPGVTTNRSIRFILFNNEETGGGAAAYVAQRRALQGIENPPGSGKFPEPKWIAMVQHDMMMWDHGMPGPDGKVNPEQRREADVNVEFQASSTYADQASRLAFFFRRMNDIYATDYPAAVGDRMSNTDSQSFQNAVMSISLRENERLAHTGTGWNPTWHQPIDVFETFSDKDFRLGLNAAQTTLSAIAALAGVKVVR